MKYFTKFISIAVLMLAIIHPAFSQIYDYNRPAKEKSTSTPPPQSIGAGLIFAVPIESTKEVENGTSYGASFSYLIGAKGITTPEEWMNKSIKPHFGFTFGMLNTKGSSLNISNSNSFQVNSNFNAQSNYLGVSGRLEFGKGFFKPYMEAKCGGMHINWRHDVEITNDTLQNNAELNLNSNGFLYGLGAGFLLGYGKVNFEFRTSWMNSQKLELIDVSTIKLAPPNDITYDTKNIRTQVLLMQLGISIHLN